MVRRGKLTWMSWSVSVTAARFGMSWQNMLRTSATSNPCPTHNPSIRYSMLAISVCQFRQCGPLESEWLAQFVGNRQFSENRMQLAHDYTDRTCLDHGVDHLTGGRTGLRYLTTIVANSRKSTNNNDQQWLELGPKATLQWINRNGRSI